MEAPSELPTTAGTVIAGKYRVEALIGEGGMGAIVKARHLALNRDVAIKLMRSEITGVHKASERFLREARATANIQSDYVAHVSDIDVLPSGIPFIVMEFLDGVDLATLVSTKRQRDTVEAVDWMLQTLSGLAAAHTLGIVHRDLKPTNLFLAKRTDGTSRIKVLDFGVSKVLDDSDFSREGHNDGLTTTSNFVVGTPRYMAPEQITAPRDVDIRADLWATGLILYEFLSGAHPFDGKTPGAIMGHVLATPILPIDSFRTDVPLALVKVVERCLQRDRNLRYSSAGQLLRDLAPFGSPQLSQGLVSLLPKSGVFSPAGAPPAAQPAAQPDLQGFAPAKVDKVARNAVGSMPSTPVHGTVLGADQGPPPTVRTPSMPGGPSGSIPVSFERTRSIGSSSRSSAERSRADQSEHKSGSHDPGTLQGWDSERGRERPKTFLLLSGVATLLLVLGGGWFFFAQSEEPSTSSANQLERTVVTKPPVLEPPVASDSPSNAEPASSAAPTPSASPNETAETAPRVAPMPPQTTVSASPTPRASPKTAPRPKAKTSVSVGKAPATPPSETTKPKASILDTRN